MRRHPVQFTPVRITVAMIVVIIHPPVLHTHRMMQEVHLIVRQVVIE
ncbi:hypothetical protein [Bacillus cereus]|nr:hypothetical protein [Bacillus cereus]MBJ8024930.1 hypothetical protein [Bacillus cereus]MBJ8038474.1 hypothetical protein [Bacillus cereus]